MARVSEKERCGEVRVRQEAWFGGGYAEVLSAVLAYAGEYERVSGDQ